ncbi:MAG: tetratricopeptide repeat protein [Muribaculaceae bacterium]|nr:tetratricopeptide repeat protein [Muribaculaceae bacterium]
MANNKKNSAETQSAIEEINDTLTGLGAKVQNNQKIIYIATGVVAIIALCILVYIYLFRQPGIQKANDAIGRADIQLALGNDSVALAQYIDVADNRSYDAANRAALQSAILLYEKGDYEQALKYIDKFSAKEAFIGAAAYSLKGDCYVNLDQLDNAIGAFKKAISQSDDNAAYTPFFMQKLARVYNAQGKYADEEKIYEAIMKDYPTYGPTYNIDIEKYLERAKANAAKK